jgi:hypothetical protein
MSALAMPLLALAPVSAAGGGQTDVLTLPQFTSAFRSICLEHIADAPAQTSVASAAPWNFAADAKDKGRYRNGRAMVFIAPASQACTLTSSVPLPETVASLEAALADIVPIEGWKPLGEADSRYVLIDLDDGGTQFVISFKISARGGDNVAVLSVSKR